VSYVIAPDAFEEACRHAAIIVATRDAPPDCDAKVIGRHDWREHGALALYRNGSGFVPPNFDRPWAPRAPPRAASAPSQDTAANPQAVTPAASRDATPRSEDLQADD
jgi:competence protein ComEC